eukprot:9099135-Alexandrium_andersonii.AAC.1
MRIGARGCAQAQVACRGSARALCIIWLVTLAVAVHAVYPHAEVLVLGDARFGAYHAATNKKSSLPDYSLQS